MLARPLAELFCGGQEFAVHRFAQRGQPEPDLLQRLNRCFGGIWRVTITLSRAYLATVVANSRRPNHLRRRGPRINCLVPADENERVHALHYTAHALCSDDMDDDDRARLVAEAMKAAGFATPGEMERVVDEDIEYVVHAAEGMPTMDKKRLREFAELLKRANQAGSVGGGEAEQALVAGQAKRRVEELEADRNRLMGRFGAELEAWAREEAERRRRRRIMGAQGHPYRSTGGLLSPHPWSRNDRFWGDFVQNTRFRRQNQALKRSAPRSSGIWAAASPYIEEYYPDKYDTLKGVYMQSAVDVERSFTQITGGDFDTDYLKHVYNGPKMQEHIQRILKHLELIDPDMSKHSWIPVHP